MSWNRLLAPAACLLGAALLWGAHDAPRAGLFLMTQVPTSIFICFAEFFSGWIGAPPFPGGLGDRPIDRESPAWLIAAFGWMILVGVFAVAYFWA